MQLQVSHESPLVLLQDAQVYNDYDYALVHLFEHEDENIAKNYFKYYQSCVRNNRHVVLDNSIFELGESFDANKYMEWIGKLQPTYYIVPDVLENASDTIASFLNWFNNIANENSEIDHLRCIGVVQGQDWNDLLACYKFMCNNADKVAISFDYNYYLSTGTSTLKYYQMSSTPGMYAQIQRGDPLDLAENPMNCSFCKDKMHRYMTGRQRFIQQLIDGGYWDWNKEHHLLGCSLPQEFKYYVNNNIYNITTVDTSNPVMAGLNWYKYHDVGGLDGKPAGLLADMMGMPADDEFPNKRKAVLYNTDMFKKIIGREPLFEHTSI